MGLAQAVAIQRQPRVVAVDDVVHPLSHDEWTPPTDIVIQWSDGPFEILKGGETKTFHQTGHTFTIVAIREDC